MLKLIRLAVFTAGIALFSFGVSFGVSFSANADSLLTNGSGIVSGATGVGAGDAFDLTFLEGTCVGLFVGTPTGCNDSTDFAFQNLGAAQTASTDLQALLTTAATTTNNIFGCSNTTTCIIYIPYWSPAALGGSAASIFSLVLNFNGTTFTSDGGPLSQIALLDIDTSSDPASVFAVASAVPLPGALVLLLSGLLGLGLTGRHRRQLPAV